MVIASLELIRQQARVVRPKRALAVGIDPADNKFLECAETASAQYLITGNQRHFPAAWQDTRVVNARELLNLIVPDIPR
jgi:predicted nucleic acid-binding protein